MKKQKEDWKEIDGFDGYYEISSMGRIMSHYGKRKILKQSGKKYRQIGLNYIGIRFNYHVSTLVWDYFGNKKRITHRDGLIHMNGDTTDNRISNLQLMSIRDITTKSYGGRNPSSKSQGVVYSKKKKRYIAGISINNKRKYIGIFRTESEAADAYLQEVRKLANKENKQNT